MKAMNSVVAVSENSLRRFLKTISLIFCCACLPYLSTASILGFQDLDMRLCLFSSLNLHYSQFYIR